jgi:hypothetical protein
MAPEKTAAPSLLGRLLASRSVDELRVIRSDIAADAQAARMTFERLQEELREVDRALAARSAEANGRTQSSRRQASPIPLRKAILTVLRERPGGWDRTQILEALEEKGWAPGGRNPRNTLTSRLAEMANEGLIMRVGSGFAATLGGTQAVLNEEEVPSMYEDTSSSSARG